MKHFKDMMHANNEAVANMCAVGGDVKESTPRIEETVSDILNVIFFIQCSFEIVVVDLVCVLKVFHGH